MVHRWTGSCSGRKEEERCEHDVVYWQCNQRLLALYNLHELDLNRNIIGDFLPYILYTYTYIIHSS